ncbi:MAG: hypothetical protein NZZ41_06050 [Candidatus Dojkabacteria bacterium]|nr:hypothetical protein [Candidatus Dojkabacteria bacterium]
MAIHKQPFQSDGIMFQFQGDYEKLDFENLINVNVGIFCDKYGNLIFKDKYVSEELKKDYITLREILVKNKGIYSRFNKEKGKVELVFKDETTSKPFTLSDILNSAQIWRKFLSSGSLWWIGGLEFDHSSCANVPSPNSTSDKKVLWSVDKYLMDVLKITQCSSINLENINSYLFDEKTGEPRWWDVQNLEIVLPPTDVYKVMILNAKLAFSAYNCFDPILFRLYDVTTNTELARTAVIQANPGKLAHPIILSYFGPIPTRKSTSRFSSIATSYENAPVSCEEDCGCDDIACSSVDPTCTTNITRSKKIYTSGSHLIKVQFRVFSFHMNLYERIFGLEYTNNGNTEYLTTSTLDCVIFNTSPSSRYTRMQGSIELNNETEKTITFNQPLESNNYCINLTPNYNINCWYSNKLTTGFTIKCEYPFKGFIDWSIIAQNT